MCFVPSSFRCLCGGVALAASVGAWTVRAADGTPPARSIEFSTPRNDTQVTNVNRLDQETRDARDFEAGFPNSQTVGAPETSLTGEFPWPAPSAGVVVNRRTKNPFGLGDNSQSLAPEETLRQMLIRDLLKSPYDEPDDANSALTEQPGSSMTRFYDQFLTARPQASNRSNPAGSFWSRTQMGDQRDSSDSENSGSRWDDSANLSPNRLPRFDPNSRSSSPGDRPGSLMDLFGPRDNRGEDAELLLESKRAEELQKRQIDDYKALLGYSRTPLDDAGQLTPSAGQNPLSTGSLATPLVPDPYNPFAMAPSTVNPTLDPGLLAPTAPQAPVPSSLAPVPFAPPLGRTTAPKPIFSVPKRAF
jgi:hypothetical protein